MGLRRATLLAATGSVLGLAFLLAQSASALVRSGTYTHSMPRVPIDGLGLMLASYFATAFFSLMLIAIYGALAGWSHRLSVKACATCAAAGFAFLTAWGTYQPFAGRISFQTNLQMAHWIVAVFYLRFGWTLFCGMLAGAGGLQKDARLAWLALAVMIPQALSGLWTTWFQVRGLVRMWNTYVGLSWIPWALTGDGIMLFGWLSLCAFLFEVWRSRPAH